MAAERGIGLSCSLEVEVVQRVKLVYIYVFQDIVWERWHQEGPVCK